MEKDFTGKLRRLNFTQKGGMLMQEELLKKLRYKQGRALVMQAPEGYALGIEDQEEPSGTYDFIQLFVGNAAEVEPWARKAIALLNEEALFWITYPKQSSKVKTDINRDSLFALINDNTDYTIVSNVAVDDKWSALRVRHKSKVKSRA
jgi:spore cortex formation protein SpoVR/YcgB (stage V sporulation)